jgi:hypothetical protein
VPISKYVVGSGVGLIGIKAPVTLPPDRANEAKTDPSNANGPGPLPPSQLINSDGNAVKTTFKNTKPGPTLLLMK